MHEALGSIPQYKLGVMVHTCNLSPQWWRQGDAKLSSAIQGAVGQSGKHETLSQGNTNITMLPVLYCTLGLKHLPQDYVVRLGL